MVLSTNSVFTYNFVAHYCILPSCFISGSKHVFFMNIWYSEHLLQVWINKSLSLTNISSCCKNLVLLFHIDESIKIYCKPIGLCSGFLFKM